MPRRRKSSSTTPVPRGAAAPLPQGASAGPQGLSISTLHLMEPFLAVLVNAGVTEFQGFGVTVRLVPRPVLERRVPVPVPTATEQRAPLPGPNSPLTPQDREAVLSRLESDGVDETSPIFDAVRRSS